MTDFQVNGDNREKSLAILEAMTKQTHDNDWIRKELLPTIGRFVKSQVEPLKARIEELENTQREFCYRGVWAVGNYKRGNFVTHDGSLWHCDADNTDIKPGTDAGAWTLAVKHGKDLRR